MDLWLPRAYTGAAGWPHPLPPQITFLPVSPNLRLANYVQIGSDFASPVRGKPSRRRMWHACSQLVWELTLAPLLRLLTVSPGQTKLGTRCERSQERLQGLHHRPEPELFLPT